MREQAVVLALDGGQALVVGQKQRGCGSCHQAAGCATLSLGGGNREVHVRAENPLGAKIGDLVTLEISDRQFLRSSFLVYVVPVLALFAGGYLFRYIGLVMAFSAQGVESLEGGAGVLCLVLAFLWLHRRNRRLETTREGLPVITDILHKDTADLVHLQPGECRHD
ncbi:MAG: SoxR reducing system RseC family protein [Magnetococcales bacterium]|nr:SoxR reducing system RseC family protein [Magnetococcales bacterium]